MRRSKNDMESMKLDCRYYLLQTNNDPHKAYDLFIKEHLESHESLPYYIKGIKDFISISQDLAVELNRKEQMNKRDQQQATEKESIVNYILNLTKEEAYSLYKQYKNTVSHTDKLNLVNVYMMIDSGEADKKNIDQSIINTFTSIIKEQSEAS